MISPGEYRIKNGNRAVVLDVSEGAKTPVIGKVLGPNGWQMEWWELDGSYRKGAPSLWDLQTLEAHEPVEKMAEIAIPSTLYANGKKVYLYVMQDILINNYPQPLRVTQHPDYGQGYIRLDALPIQDVEAFKFALKNPVLSNKSVLPQSREKPLEKSNGLMDAMNTQ